MLVAIAALGPKLTNSPVSYLGPAELTGAFTAAFLFVMVVEVIGIVLILAVPGKDPTYSTEGEPVAGF